MCKKHWWGTFSIMERTIAQDADASYLALVNPLTNMRYMGYSLRVLLFPPYDENTELHGFYKFCVALYSL